MDRNRLWHDQRRELHCRGASLAGCQGGQVYAYGAGYGTGAGLATYIANGGDGSGAECGLIDVLFVPATAETVVVANGGLGGAILIEDAADVPSPQFQVFGNGVLDHAGVTVPTMFIGSVAGSGMVLLAGHSLSVGNNHLSTTFSGVILESGRLIKLGTGTFTLSEANTYTGGTTVSAGILRVTNTTGSATGSGSLEVDAGTLGGQGIVQGAVTIGTDGSTGAFLAPSVGANQPAALSIKKALALNADSTYTFKLMTRNARADQIIAKGVTIASGARFDLQAVGNKKLSAGAVFTVISNTSANAISGAFVNLADHSILTVGRNKYHSTYEGGDGNDLTLTVIP